MDHYKEVTKLCTEYVNTTCDICGNDVCPHGNLVDRVELSHEEGEDSYDESFTSTLSVDMCGKCFKRHIVPTLKDAGLNVKYK